MDKRPFTFKIEVEIENDIEDLSARLEAEKALKTFCRIKNSERCEINGHRFKFIPLDNSLKY